MEEMLHDILYVLLRVLSEHSFEFINELLIYDAVVNLFDLHYFGLGTSAKHRAT